MAPLDRLPGGLLLRPVLLLLPGQPSDGGGVKEDLGTGHGGETGGLRVPLVPADQHADPTEAGIPRAKAQVARGEIELLVVLRVVRNMHLPVLAQEPAVR